MEKLLQFVLLELFEALILKKAISVARHHWVRLQPIDKIKRKIYEESVRDQLEKKDPLLMAIYQNQEIANKLLFLLKISDPDILEDTIGSLKRKYGLKEELVRPLVWDYLRKLLLHPRASELEHQIGVFGNKSLSQILENPEYWAERSKKPLPGDYLSYNYRRFGQSLSNQGNWSRALEFFSKAVQKSENDKEKAKSLRECGIMLLNLGRYKEAVPNLKESIRLAEKFEELEQLRIGAEGSLARIAIHQGNLTYAEKIFWKHENYHFLGRIYYERGRYEQSIRMLELDQDRNEILRPYVDDQSYHHAVGFTSRLMSLNFVRLGENKKAEYFWEKSKDKFLHNYAYAHLLLDKGVLALQSGNLISAVGPFERAIGIWEPLNYLKGYLENTLYLGKAWFTLKEYKRAMRALKVVLDKSKPMGKSGLRSEANILMERIKAKYGEKKFIQILKEIRMSEKDKIFWL